MSIESLMLDTNQNLDEDGAFFYVEYKDGSMTEISFRTAKMAKNAYNLYSKEPLALSSGSLL